MSNNADNDENACVDLTMNSQARRRTIQHHTNDFKENAKFKKCSFSASDSNTISSWMQRSKEQETIFFIKKKLSGAIGNHNQVNAKH